MSVRDDQDLLVLAHRTFSLSQCDVIVGMFKAYGVEAYAFDRAFNTVASHLLVATGGYRIMVRESQLSAAQDLLNPFLVKPELQESSAFKKRPISNSAWLLFCLMCGLWAPTWLRHRDR